MDEEDEEAPELVEVPGDNGKVVPVSIITGYLGSGKSTLLNYLLRANHGKRIAIIENEFGAGLGIEGMIAKSGLDNSSLEGFFELNNGCICCTVKDDLLVTLEQLVLHKDRFDYIIIETTGVANPGPVISTFWTDDSLGSCLKLDGVVCVVDAANLGRYLASADTASDVQMQISFADRILLNKSDLVDAATLEAASRSVSAINSSAELRVTLHSNIDPSWVLDIDSYSQKRLPTTDSLRLPPGWSGQSWGTDSVLCAPCQPDDASSDRQAASVSQQPQQPAAHSAATLGTVALSFPGSLDLTRLNRLLDALLYDNGRSTLGNATSVSASAPASHVSVTVPADGVMHIFRLKGVLQPSEQEGCVLVLQAVHDVFEIQPSSFAAGGVGDTSKGLNHVIIIGRFLDRQRLEEGFLSCLV